MSAKKITIDDLAIMMQGSFSDMENRFSGIDKRFDVLEKRMNDGFLAVNKDLADVKADVHDMKMILKPLVKTSDIQEEEIGELKIRVNKLEDKVFVG